MLLGSNVFLSGRGCNITLTFKNCDFFLVCTDKWAQQSKFGCCGLTSHRVFFESFESHYHLSKNVLNNLLCNKSGVFIYLINKGVFKKVVLVFFECLCQVLCTKRLGRYRGLLNCFKSKILVVLWVVKISSAVDNSLGIYA